MENVIKALQAIQAKQFKHIKTTIVTEVLTAGIKVFFHVEKTEDIKRGWFFYSIDSKERQAKLLEEIQQFIDQAEMLKIYKFTAQAIYTISVRPPRGSESGVDDYDEVQITNISAEVSGLTQAHAIKAFEHFVERELRESDIRFVYNEIKLLSKEPRSFDLEAEVLEFNIKN